MTNRERIETLERRRVFLTGRVANYRRAGDPSRDRAECAALEWALQIIRAAEKEGILDDLLTVALPAVGGG